MLQTARGDFSILGFPLLGTQNEIIIIIAVICDSFLGFNVAIL